MSAVAAGQKQKADFLDSRFSPQLKVAQTDWLSGVKVRPEGVPEVIPPGTPLELPSYVVPEQVASNEDAARAEALLADADRFSAMSTQFVLIAVLLALVLFFASVATKFGNPKLQVLLTAVALGLLVFGILRVLFLPNTF